MTASTDRAAALPAAADFAGPVRLSLAAPAYNEAAGIAAVVRDWHACLAASPDVAAFEIVVCNDGSRDRTGEILDALAAELPQLRPLHFARNQGAAAALAAAIAATRHDWVLLIDSDGQFPVEDGLAMLAAARRAGALAAIGIRQKKDRWFARFGTWSSGIACNLLFGTRLRDFNSAFKAVWGPLLRGLTLEARGMNYSTEVTARLLECGVRPLEVAVGHRPRATGTSNMRLLRGALHRLLFVCYFALRRLLIAAGVLMAPRP